MQARLYLQAKSEKRFTYTPDWVQCETKLNNKKVLITMDLIGDTDYSLHGLDCEFKGELLPFSYWDEEGEEINLMNYHGNMEPYINAFLEGIKSNKGILIGIYPTDDSNNEYKHDKFRECKGKIVFNNEEIDFDFEAEIY